MNNSISTLLWVGIFVLVISSTRTLADAAPVPARLLLRLSCDGAIKDSASHHYHLVPTDISYDSNTKTGQSSAFFNGQSSFVRLGDDENPNIVKGAFSVCFWIKTSDIPQITVLDPNIPNSTTLQQSDPGASWQYGGEIIDCDTAGYTTDWGIAITGGVLAFGIGGATPTGDSADTTLHSSAQITDGHWHYVVTTWNKTTKDMQIWIDGTMTDTDKSQNSDDRTNSNVLTVGRLSAGGGGFLKGNLSEIQIYDQVLTKDQIQSLHTHPGRTLDEVNDQFGH